MSTTGNIYFLQFGVFTSFEVMEENTKNLDNFLIITEDNKYYVYLGAYTNIENATNYQKILENKKIYTYIKNDYLNPDKVKEIKKIEDELSINNINEINKEILLLIKE